MQNLITYVLFNFRFVNSGSISPYLVRMQENTDKNNSKYEHILRSVKAFKEFLTCVAKVKKVIWPLFLFLLLLLTSTKKRNGNSIFM